MMKDHNGSRTEKFCTLRRVFLFLREGRRTAAIGHVIGAIEPEVLAVHEGDGTILMRDAGAISDEAVHEESLINTIIEMQRISMKRIEELEAGSLMTVDSEWVESNIEWILNHEGLNELWAQDDSKMNESHKELVEELRRKVGTVQEACRKLASYKLPKALVHGDLGFHNVGSRKKGKGGMYCFFDWGRAFIGNPVYDFDRIARAISADGLSMKWNDVISLFRKHWMPWASDDDIRSVLKISEIMLPVRQIYEYESYGSLCATHSLELMGDALIDLDTALDTL